MSDTSTVDTKTDDAHQESDAEVKARRLGWVPKEEFRGDPDKHRSAEEFLDRGTNLLPLLQRDNEKLHKNFDRVERELRETKEVLSDFRDFASKSEERAYKRAKVELETKLDTAIQSADVETARATRREMAALDEDRKPVAETRQREPDKPQQGDKVIQDWISDNDWYRNDPALNGFATKMFGKLEREKPGAPKEDLLAETKRLTMDKFPEEFGINPRREAASAVGAPSGGSGTQKKKGKSYEDLPADAKKACDKFVKTIKGFTREQYVKDFDWD